MKSLIVSYKWQIAAIIAIIHHLPAVPREDSKGQRIIILFAAMMTQHLFGFWQRGIVK